MVLFTRVQNVRGGSLLSVTAITVQRILCKILCLNDEYITNIGKKTCRVLIKKLHTVISMSVGDESSTATGRNKI